MAFLAPPGFQYVALQWGIWRAGGIAVPLSLFHPRPELEYVLDDTTPAAVIAHPDFVDRLKPIAVDRGLRFAQSTDALEHPLGKLPTVATSRRAMILYTSGTTGKPKGVVTTHDNITAQITSLIQAWEWTADDRILEFLPLHHIHGIVNVISCALWAGAVCEIIPEFDARKVWDRSRSGRFDVVHGSAHHLREAHRCLAEVVSCRSEEDVRRLPQDAGHDIRISGPAGEYAGEVAGGSPGTSSSRGSE